jgi:hypothetical protein
MTPASGAADVRTTGGGDLYAAGYAFLAIGAICVAVSVIGRGVSLGMRSTRD